MNKLKWIVLVQVVFLVCITGKVFSNDNASDKLKMKGQLSSVLHVNPGNDLPVWMGGRYIPQLNYNIELPQKRLIDFEVSGNIYGNAAFNACTYDGLDGRVKPYRAWMRYSTRQLEIRAGLQKINFGSASILRPLMWFDQVDPRDPLRLTDGVWGLLGRYYFLNNTNVWLWALYGNKNPRGWEIAPTTRRKPEFGARLQTPLNKGEIGFSYHHRLVNTTDISEDIPEFNEVPENKFGFDARFDLAVGCWLEGSLTTNKKEIGVYTNQSILNMGIDYTFGVGNGLYMVYEQLFASVDEEAFSFSKPLNFSLLSVSYPIGLFDDIGAIFYYNWSNNTLYNFIRWQKQFDKITLYTIAYINPENYQIPTQGDTSNMFGGFGMQLIFVFNH